MGIPVVFSLHLADYLDVSMRPCTTEVLDYVVVYSIIGSLNWVVLITLCHFFILCKTKMTHDQANIRHGSRITSST